jgi:hypothetical protein
MGIHPCIPFVPISAAIAVFPIVNSDKRMSENTKRRAVVATENTSGHSTVRAIFPHGRAIQHRETTMNGLLKAICVTLYLLVLASLFTELPIQPKIVLVMQYAVIALLAAHVIEVIVWFKFVRLYRGPLATSILLTLLFGLMHWQPLMKTR